MPYADLIKKERLKKYYIENKEKYKENNKKWMLKNKEKRREYKKNYLRKKRKTDILFVLIKNMRSRVRRVLVRNKKVIHKKIAPTMKLLGCSKEEFKKHIESKFTKGMSWSKIHLIHIDHIKPCASFDLSDPKQQKMCFHYTNLQPLWAVDNLKKGARLNYK